MAVDAIGPSGEIVNPAAPPPPPAEPQANPEPASAPAPLPAYEGTQVDTSA
ncbi:MAG: hypothetical protein LBT68_04255 [Spirochaetales bacterium]|jgi:hypothetical protein|nr:hypothetical protein [Spirochaetales bacterium]